MTDGAKGGFVAGVLLGVTAGVLLAPRRKQNVSASGEMDVPLAEPAAAEPWMDQDAAAVLRGKIEETRRRLREQVGAPSEP